jgi:hypothetical protein
MCMRACVSELKKKWVAQCLWLDQVAHAYGCLRDLAKGGRLGGLDMFHCDVRALAHRLDVRL